MLKLSLERRTFNIWFPCISMGLFLQYTLIQLSIFNILNIEITNLLDLTAAEVGYLSSYYLFAIVIFLIPIGVLLDQYKNYKLIILLAGILSIVGSSFLFTCSYWSWLFSRILAGISNITIFLSGLKLINLHYRKNVAFSIGLFAAIGNAAYLIISGPYTYIKILWGKDILLLINLLMGIIYFSLIVKFVESEEKRINSLPNRKSFSHRLIEIFILLKTVIKFKENWLCGLYIAILSIPSYLLASLWGNLYFTQKYGFSDIQAGMIIQGYTLGVLFGAPIIGWFIDQVSNYKKIMRSTNLLLIGIFIILQVNYSIGFYCVISLLTLVGVICCADLAGYAYLQKYNPRSLIGIAMSLVLLLVNLINALLQPAFGWILQRNWDGIYINNIPIYNKQDLKSAFLILPIAFFVSYLFTYFIRENKKVVQ